MSTSDISEKGGLSPSDKGVPCSKSLVFGCWKLGSMFLHASRLRMIGWLSAPLAEWHTVGRQKLGSSLHGHLSCRKLRNLNWGEIFCVSVVRVLEAPVTSIWLKFNATKIFLEWHCSVDCSTLSMLSMLIAALSDRPVWKLFLLSICLFPSSFSYSLTETTAGQKRVGNSAPVHPGSIPRSLSFRVSGCSASLCVSATGPSVVLFRWLVLSCILHGSSRTGVLHRPRQIRKRKINRRWNDALKQTSTSEQPQIVNRWGEKIVVARTRWQMALADCL